jgi:hypothetical protein
MFVSKATLFEIFFDCHFLPEEFPEEDLAITAFADGFDDLDLLFLDQKGQLNPLFIQILGYLG